MNLEVSVGEAIDKFSILEIKSKHITDEYKKYEIIKELNKLEQCKSYIEKYPFYYKLLIYVNQKIWDLTNHIKMIDVSHVDFSIISKNIFDYNQKRFRIKNWFNMLNVSEINEQKSYHATYCKVCISEKDYIYDKIAEINFLLLEYDIVIFDTLHIDIINQLFKVPTYVFANESQVITENIINIYDYNIKEPEELSYFDFPYISYISGGAFGDFIHQISVINENFYNTGQKGLLYLSRDEHHFFGGFEYTYNDTYTLLKSQRYIHDYKIHCSEAFDCNLSYWRNHPDIFLNGNWYNTFKQIYNIEWGKHKWIYTTIDEKYKDMILINTTDYRWPTNIDFTSFCIDTKKKKMLFICSDIKQYEFFISKTSLTIDILLVNNFNDLCVAINSCKLFIGSQSGPLAIAHATHKDRICGNSPNSSESLFLHGLTEIWDNIVV